ncbi:MAG: homocysteine S-methyltransferase family protein, partial [Kiritimatiellaeota bacterium]|nr:homocysteine S-methyltransferase family protein [Kiritimatiellota bacterium]
MPKPLHLHALATPLLFDGAMGTLLHERGLQPGECPELWCATRPGDLRAIHRLYKEAGADVLETNSFGANLYKLGHYGLANRLEELNREAARLAREVAGEDGHVLGSIGPTGAFMEPYGDETEEAFLDTFARQAAALREG